MQRTYKDVAAVDRVVRYVDVHGRFAENRGTQHWQQVDGRWYIIYD